MALGRALAAFFGAVDLVTSVSSLVLTLADRRANFRPCESVEPTDRESEAHKLWTACQTVQNWLMGIGFLSVGAGWLTTRWVRSLSVKLKGQAAILNLSADDLVLLDKLGDIGIVARELDDLLANYSKKLGLLCRS